MADNKILRSGLTASLAFLDAYLKAQTRTEERDYRRKRQGEQDEMHRRESEQRIRSGQAQEEYTRARASGDVGSSTDDEDPFGKIVRRSSTAENRGAIHHEAQVALNEAGGDATKARESIERKLAELKEPSLAAPDMKADLKAFKAFDPDAAKEQHKNWSSSKQRLLASWSVLDQWGRHPKRAAGSPGSQAVAPQAQPQPQQQAYGPPAAPMGAPASRPTSAPMKGAQGGSPSRGQLMAAQSLTSQGGPPGQPSSRMTPPRMPDTVTASYQNAQQGEQMQALDPAAQPHDIYAAGDFARLFTIAMDPNAPIEAAAFAWSKLVTMSGKARVPEYLKTWATGMGINRQMLDQIAATHGKEQRVGNKLAEGGMRKRGELANQKLIPEMQQRAREQSRSRYQEGGGMRGRPR